MSNITMSNHFTSTSVLTSSLIPVYLDRIQETTSTKNFNRIQRTTSWKASVMYHAMITRIQLQAVTRKDHQNDMVIDNQGSDDNLVHIVQRALVVQSLGLELRASPWTLFRSTAHLQTYKHKCLALKLQTNPNHASVLPSDAIIESLQSKQKRYPWFQETKHRCVG